MKNVLMGGACAICQTWKYAADIGEDGSCSAGTPSRLTTEWSSSGTVEWPIGPGKVDALDSLIGADASGKMALATSRMETSPRKKSPDQTAPSTDFKFKELFMNAPSKVDSALRTESELQLPLALNTVGTLLFQLSANLSACNAKEKLLACMSPELGTRAALCIRPFLCHSARIELGGRGL